MFVWNIIPCFNLIYFISPLLHSQIKLYLGLALRVDDIRDSDHRSRLQEKRVRVQNFPSKFFLVSLGIDYLHRLV
jgi:hypothetical protein